MSRPAAQASPTDWVEYGAGRVLAWWHGPLQRGMWPALVLAAILAAACLLRAYIGMEALHYYTHDGFVVLDGGWRILQGRRPNIDFFNDLGPFIYLATALGLKLAHGSPAGFGWMQGAMGAIFGTWTLALARGRLGPVARALFCGTIVLLAISPFTQGDSILHTAPAEVYNRFGYCAIALAMLEGTLAAEPVSALREMAGGFSTGFLAAFCLFLKITYFLWMLPLVLLLVPCRAQTRARWVGIAAGFLSGLLPVFLWDGGNLAPMLRDLYIVSGGKHIQWHWHMLEALYFSVAPMLLFLLIAEGLLWATGARGRQALQPAVAGCAALIGGYLLLLTNFQFDIMPLNGIGAILILQLLNARPAASNQLLLRAAVTLWGLWLILTPVVLDGAGLLWSGVSRMRFAHNTWYQFEAPRLAGMSSFEHDYVEFVNDGIHLLEQRLQPGDTVMSTDFSTPFSFALGIPPARGGTADLQWGTNFDDRHHPPAEWLFGQSTIVMEPIVSSDPSRGDTVPRVYGPYLSAHYHLAGESSQWKLYRRNDR